MANEDSLAYEELRLVSPAMVLIPVSRLRPMALFWLWLVA